MKKLLSLAVWAISLTAFSNTAAVFKGTEASQKVPGATMVRMYNHTNIPAFVKFSDSQELPVSKFEAWLNQYNDSQFPIGLERISQKKDRTGQVHYKYKVTLNGFPIENGIYILHTRGGFIQSMNGEVDLAIEGNSVAISSNQALDLAKAHIGASIYKWEIEEEEEHLKHETHNPSASYVPNPKLVWIRKDAKRGAAIELAYKMNIYANKPLYRADIYISASTGEVLFENKEIKHADENGTAETKYSGTQTIVADNTGSNYRLRETGRGNGINTFNMQQGTNYGNAVDFVDDDNVWNNVNANVDEAATDAHWGAEMTYDYFLQEHNRNSIDGSGFTLNSYIHYDQDYGNAFWDGQRMTYGDGGNGTRPFCALDIAGHEITHGLITYSANLVYQNESGALNESFADIFGVSIEWFARPGNANWLMGEDLGFVIRNMENPNQYGDPDTYNGQFWYTGTGDNGGVHTNSGVQNFWYYLLVNGGTGTNDIGDAYTVNALGFEDASNVAFRNLTVYLTSSSDYFDARFYAIQSAIDLFGSCTPEVESVTNAWYAVGLGQEYVNEVVADFEVSLAEGCSAPFQTSFKNLSFNATSFSWDMGNGDTSTDVNPSATYNALGDYTVSLIADGGACGKDTLEIVDYISVDPANECLVIMNGSSNNTTQTGCFGRLVDDGGVDGDYSPNMSTTVTVEPNGADQVILYFDFFDVESGDDGTCNYDLLEVFEGSSTTGNLVGEYCNTSLPPSQLIVSGSAATVRFQTDPGLQQGGFEIRWACSQANTAPVVDFTANTTLSCQPNISFTDYSLNGPTSWSWDFGDGTSSTDQNPVHHYSATGTYEVKLVATNAYGEDSLIRSSYIDIDLPQEPTNLAKDPLDTCFNAPVTLTGSALNEIRWYENYGDPAPVGSGSPFTTPVIPASTVYYAENFVEGQSTNVGKVDNSGGGGNFNNPDQYLIFSVYQPMVLQTVKVFAQGAENRTIELRGDDGAVIDSRTVFIEDGEQVVTLDFDIMPGTDYQLGLIPVIEPNLYRNNNGVQYPYSVAGLMSIERSSAGQNPTSYYYWFYDWQVKPSDCQSELVPINIDLEECLLSVDEIEQNITVYPNPSSQMIFVEGLPVNTYAWSVVDVSGKVVLNGGDLELQQGIEVSKLVAGMYVLKITDGVNTFQKNVIKE